MIFEPNFAAGYYLSITFICFIVILAVPYQAAQIYRYFNRRRYPNLVDLPTTTREKSLKSTNELSQVGRMSVAIIPDQTPIHFAPRVWLHKSRNYVISVFGVGDMSIGELFLFALFMGANAFFLYMPFQQGVSITQDFSNRCAYLALANSAFVFPLATRNSIILTLIGVPFERIIRYHRWIGRIIFFQIAFHGSYNIQVQYKVTHKVYDALFNDNQYATGFWAFLALAIIMITSHSIVRRYAFEVFYWSHFAFIIFFIFGALHTNWFLPFVGFGGALYVVDRIIRAIKSFKSTKILAIEAIPSGVTRVVFEPHFLYEAGQYVFVNFPNLHKPFSYIQWHPISLSSAPGITDGDDDIHYASLHIKAAGGFTKSLHSASQSSAQPSLRVKVDGPYGKSSIDFTEYRTVLLVAGGVGVTPMISLLRNLVDRQKTRLPIITQSIYFVWVIPDIDSYNWLAGEIEEILNLAASLPKTQYLLDLSVYMTRGVTTPSSIFFQGRPDFSFLMQKIKHSHGSGDVAVGACGPAVMVKGVRNAAVEKSDLNGLFHVHNEVFEF